MYSVDVERLKGITRVLNAVTGWFVYWAYQNTKEPESVAISVSLVSNSGDMLSETSYEEQIGGNDGLIEKNRTIQEYTLSLKAKGDGANAILKELSTKLRLQFYRDMLTEEAGFSYITSEPVRNLTGLEENKYKEIANLDIVLRTTKIVSVETNYFDTVTMP